MARPREFDEKAVLAAARDAFWSKGYEATSTRDLVQVTGLSQPSLYNAFGDKRALFERALQFYLDHTLRLRINRLEAELKPGEAIAAFFAEVIDRSVMDTERRGCMLVNSALDGSLADSTLKAAIEIEIQALRSFLLRNLQALEQPAPALAALGAEQAASHLLAVLLGIRVLARVSPERSLLNATISPALHLLGLPPLPVAAG